MQRMHRVWRHACMIRVICIFGCLGGCLALGGWSIPAYAATYELSGPDRVVREGYFQLDMQLNVQLSVAVTEATDHARFVVEMSDAEDFSAIAATFTPLGSFTRLSLSGFDDGVYYFRLRSGSATQTDTTGEVLSNVVRVEVRHYPLSRALALFVAGAVLFSILLALIVRFSWRDRKAGSGGSVRD